MPKQKYQSKSTSLFDIRLRNLDHDVIVLKGSEHTAASTFLSGRIVFSVSEPITVKKISLRLYGTLRLRFPETSKAHSSRLPRFDKKLYEHVWDSTEFSKYLSNMYANSSVSNSSSVSEDRSPSHSASKTPLLSSLTKSHGLKGSTTSLKNLGSSLRSMSSTSLAHSASVGSSSQNLSSPNLVSKATHVLVSGNYEIPFQAILPGDMPESVEGLPGANVVYKLEAQIDRGKFHNAMVTRKHVRIVRTLTTDAAELSETMAVDNTWPKKVEYSLSVPSKAIAIGSGTPVSLMFVPLLKGLQLGEIKMTLIEIYSFVSYMPPPYTSERVICEKVIPPPSENDDNFQMDKWEVTTFLKVPPNLSKCTQDCDINTNLKVRHKLKFTIGLRNPDGHISELRASLPVQLFISPFVGIRVKTEDDDDDDEPTSQHHEEEDIFRTDYHANSHDEAVNGDAEGENEQGNLRSNPHSSSSFTGLVAPPVYEQHVYDQLWTDVSPIDSPLSSGAQTPRSLYSRPGPGDVSQFSMSSIDSAKLTENLRQLSIQRQLQEGVEGNSRSSTPGRAVFNLDDDSTEGGDYFTRARPKLGHTLSSNQIGNGISSVGITSPVHVSRVNSDSNLSDAVLSKVPSYNEAIKSNVDDSLAPTYMPPQPGSSIDIIEVNRRFEESTTKSTNHSSASHLASSRNRSFLSRGASSLNLKGSSSRNSSTGSSPSGSRSVSHNNLTNLSGDYSSRNSSSRLTRTTGSATFSMAP